MTRVDQGVQWYLYYRGIIYTKKVRARKDTAWLRKISYGPGGGVDRYQKFFGYDLHQDGRPQAGQPYNAEENLSPQTQVVSLCLLHCPQIHLGNSLTSATVTMRGTLSGSLIDLPGRKIRP